MCCFIVRALKHMYTPWNTHARTRITDRRTTRSTTQHTTHTLEQCDGLKWCKHVEVPQMQFGDTVFWMCQYAECQPTRCSDRVVDLPVASQRQAPTDPSRCCSGFGVRCEHSSPFSWDCGRPGLLPRGSRGHDCCHLTLWGLGEVQRRYRRCVVRLLTTRQSKMRDPVCRQVFLCLSLLRAARFVARLLCVVHCTTRRVKTSLNN